MADKFQDTYRIPSARAKWWDYSADGIYFITICTYGHACFFGQIINKQMVLSSIGLLVQKEWDKSFAIRKELKCEAFVIMPNHIHAILRIERPVETHGGASPDPNNQPAESPGGASDNSINHPVEFHGGVSYNPDDTRGERDAPPCVSTTRQLNHYGIAYGPPKSISSFVAGFKSVVTVKAIKINPCFGWQDRFYDSIIRNDENYQRIADYIENNPVNWGKDKFFTNEV